MNIQPPTFGSVAYGMLMGIGIGLLAGFILGLIVWVAVRLYETLEDFIQSL